MSKRYEGFIVAFEDASWRTTNVASAGHPLWVDEESFDMGKEIIDNNNLTRAGRASNGSSQISGAVKPTASFTYQPRNTELVPILYSHYQMGTELGDGSPGTYVFVPSRYPPTFTEDNSVGIGDYDSDAGDAYSLTFVKKYFSDNAVGDSNSLIFRHGLCDKLTVRLERNEDLKFDCEYKFRDLNQSSNVSVNPPDATYGTYETTPAMQWFHGTVTVNGQAMELDSLQFTGNNQLTERIEIGRRDPENFAFGAYELTGNFTLDFPKDGFDQIERLFSKAYFAITGTIVQGTVSIVFDMPYCIRQPFNVLMNEERVNMTIPFKAFEDSGNSPITVTVNAGGDPEPFDDDYFDAGGGARTFGEFTIWDAADGARTLSEYTYYDRDL